MDVKKRLRIKRSDSYKKQLSAAGKALADILSGKRGLRNEHRL